MTENEKPQPGLELRTAAVTDEFGGWHVHLQFALGMLSAGVAIPVDKVPDFVGAFRKVVMQQYKETLELAGGLDPRLAVVENKLIIPGRD